MYTNNTKSAYPSQQNSQKRLYLRGKTHKYSNLAIKALTFILEKQLKNSKVELSQSIIAEAIGSSREYVNAILGEIGVINKRFRGYTYDIYGNRFDRVLGYSVNQYFINNLSCVAIGDQRFVHLLNLRNDSDYMDDDVRVEMLTSLGIKDRHHFNRFRTGAISHAYKSAICYMGKIINMSSYIYFVARDYHLVNSIPFM